MQPSNNDMDELFRDAAGAYPLKTEGADWSKVQRELQAAEGEEGHVVAEKSKRKYAWLLLLLLIPFICTRFYRGEKDTTDSNTVAGPAQRDAGKNGAAKNSQAVPAPAAPASPGTFENNGTGKKIIHSSIASPVLYEVRKDKKNGDLKHRTSFSTVDKNKQTDVEAIDKTNNTQTGLTDAKVPNAGIEKKEAGRAGDVDRIAVEATGNQPQAAAPVTQQDSTRAVVLNKVGDTAAVQKSDRQQKGNNKRLFLSVLAGPDFTAVKSVHTNGARGGGGIAISYRFAKRLSIEAGALWTEKKYYSKGKYFNTSKIALPQHTTVLDVDGVCRLIELPLTIRYNFSSAPGDSWFAVAGATSYFMKEEMYDYWYERYNMKYYGDKEYKNSGKDLFSVLQLSGGYQKTLGRTTLLRIEPYIKLPLKGIGTGSLPLISGGMYVGITLPVR